MKLWRVIHNQDSTDLFVLTKEPITAAHVDEMVDDAAVRGVDVFLVNPNAQQACYPSRVWQRYWDDFHPGDNAWFGLPPDCSEGDNAGRGHWIGQMQRLAQQCDYLERALARCRLRGVTPGVSVRMNDIHDAPWPTSHIHSRFYKDHPEWRLDGLAARGWSGKALNYAVSEVREHYLKLIREIANGYDFDVMELDFLRFPNYFNRANLAPGRDIMTTFIGEVRHILDATGRHIELLPRLAATPAGADELGFDFRNWIERGFIDGLIVSEFLRTGWEIPLDRWRSLVDDRVPVYPGLEALARYWHLPQQHGERMAFEPTLVRGAAMGYRALGAPGVYTFNFFRGHEANGYRHPCYHALRDAEDLTAARRLPRRHLVSAGLSQIETDLPLQTPVEVESGGSREFRLLAAAAAPDMTIAARIIISRPVQPADVWLRMNDLFVGSASAVGCSPLGGQTSLASCSLPSDLLRDGFNDLTVRVENGPGTILGVEITVE